MGGSHAFGGQLWGPSRPTCGVLWSSRALLAPQAAAARLGGPPGEHRGSRRGICVSQAAQDGDSAAVGAGDAYAAAAGTAVAEAVQTDTGRVLDVELHAEVERSYLSYAMSVIVGRALPDVRDGLKPVHRRILYAMYDLGLLPTKPFRKSARVVGEVLGKYHPHGDSAVYDALVRLAQPFSMRLPLVDGHGNFGSQDNDPAAAMRYTECRLQRAATASLLADLEQDTVDWVETFDGSEREPAVLPARLPNLLINGSQGIAVGTATNIPPHNAREVVAALEALITNPDVSLRELMTHVPGPDFPTGGEILASPGLEEAYSSGRGPITVRGRALIESEGAPAAAEGAGARKSGRKGGGGGGKGLIIITELPFQTNKAALVEHIAALAADDKLQGVSDVRDESDREGMRVVVELKRGAVPEVVLNNLYSQTALQKRFSCNLVALVGGVPVHLGLKDLLAHFLAFRCEVVARRARFEQAKAQRRLHIVDGLVRAQGQLDAVVATIRGAPDSAAAADGLKQLLGLSPEQTDAVLGLALRRLTGMEVGKLRAEEAELQAQLAALAALLGSDDAIRQRVLAEARELQEALGDERRTLVRRDVDGVLQQEDIIPNRQSLIVFSSRGYIKRMAADFFSTQGRGGKGMKVAALKGDDSLEELQVVRDHQSLVFFTTDGQVFTIKAYEVPQASRTAAGTALPQVVKMGKEQRMAAMLPVTSFDEEEAFVLLLSRKGLVKRLALQAFARMRPGSSAMELAEGDELVWVRLCGPEDDVILATSDGVVQRTPVALYRPMGRKARGLKAVTLRGDASIVGMSIVPSQELSSGDEEEEDEEEEEEADSSSESEAGAAADPGDGPCILMVTEKGHGKRVPAHMFRAMASRAKKGVYGVRLGEGDRLAAFHVITSADEALLSSLGGNITRISLASVPLLSRVARGAIVMRFKNEGDRISTVTLIDSDADSA